MFDHEYLNKLESLFKLFLQRKMNTEILFSNKFKCRYNLKNLKKNQEFDSLNSPPNTVCSQCYADHFCGGVAQVNGTSEFDSCCALVKFISQRR
jgi:hypothetical protein